MSPSRLLKWKAFSPVTKWGRSPALITALLHLALHSLPSSPFSISLLSSCDPALLSLLLFYIIHLNISPSLCFLFIWNILSPISPRPFHFFSFHPLEAFFFPIRPNSPQASVSLNLTTSILPRPLCFIYLFCCLLHSLSRVSLLTTNTSCLLHVVLFPCIVITCTVHIHKSLGVVV